MKKLRKQAGILLGTGIGLSAGSAVLGKMNSPITSSAQSGLSTLSGFMPVIATGIGAGAVVRSLDYLSPKNKQKKKIKTLI